jgi:hypothetical protein
MEVSLRVGLRDGNRSDSVETPVAIAECVALGVGGDTGIVAESKAYSRRTLGVCLEQGLTSSPSFHAPAPCAKTSKRGGSNKPPYLLLGEKPGRTKAEAPRRWHGQSVIRQVEVE